MEITRRENSDLWSSITKVLFLLLLGLGVLLPGNAAMAVTAKPHLLVTPLDVWENRDHCLIIDLRDRELYLEGHVPGAIHLGARGHKLLRENRYIVNLTDKETDPKVGRLIEHLELRLARVLEQVFAAAGVSHDDTVILYSDHEDTLPGYTFVPFVVLEYLGHRDVRVMDGGIENWWSHRLPLEAGENRLPSSDFRARLRPEIIADEDEILRLARFNPSYLADIGVDPHQFELPQLEFPSPAVINL